MRVPIIDQQSIFTSGEIAPSGGPALVRPTSIAAELRAFGASLERVGDVFAEAQAQAQKEANALVGAESDLQLDEYANKTLNGGDPDESDVLGEEPSRGFLTTQGLDAARTSNSAIEALHAKRQEIADGIQDPTAKAKFLVRSADRLAAYSARIEGHVSREFETARNATTQGLVAQHLAASEAGADYWTRTISARQVEDHLRELAPTQEAGDAAVAAFKAADAFAFTQGQLAEGNVDDAAAFVENNRETLGSKYAEAKHAVDAKMAATKKDRTNAEVAGIVAKWTDAARDANGFVTEDALRQQFEDLPPEDPRRDELQAAFEKNVRRERAKLDAANKKAVDQAELAALVDGRPIPAEAEAHLRKYDPSALVAIREKQRANFRRWKTEKDGTAKEKLEARRQQAEADKVFINELEKELTNNPGTDPKDFEKQWVARRAEEGKDVTTPSDVARSEAGLSASKAVRGANKAEATERRQLASEFEKTIVAATRVRGKPVDPPRLNERVGNALRLYDRAVEENGGRPLSRDLVARLNATFFQDVVTASHWYGDTRKPRIDTVGAGASAPPDAPRSDPRREAALQWLDANPDDPRAPAVRRKLGVDIGAGAPASPTNTKASGPVRMRFPDGKVYEVPAEKMDAATRKGGIRVE